MFFIKIYIKESYINYYHTSIQMCGQYCILAPTNLHNIVRSDRVGFKTKNPTEVQTYSVNLCCLLDLNFLFYQNSRKVTFRLSGIKCNRVIDGVS